MEDVNRQTEIILQNKNSGEELQDFDYFLELISIVAPRNDARKITANIINDFGTFSKFSSASLERMIQVDGVDQNIAKVAILIRQAALAILRNRISNRPVIDNYDALYDYIKADIGGSSTEKMKIFFLDNMHHLLKDATIAEGSFDALKICVRETLRITLDVSASAIIMVHNHPSGPSKPSKQDIIFTKNILSVLNAINVAVVDHIVVGTDGFSSMKKLNMI
jgi:DNA repair protein RadC